MTSPNATRQKAHRQRRAAKISRMDTALNAIVTRLDGNNKPLAVELRKIAQEGLK